MGHRPWAVGRSGGGGELVALTVAWRHVMVGVGFWGVDQAARAWDGERARGRGRGRGSGEVVEWSSGRSGAVGSGGVAWCGVELAR